MALFGQKASYPLFEVMAVEQKFMLQKSVIQKIGASKFGTFL